MQVIVLIATIGLSFAALSTLDDTNTKLIDTFVCKKLAILTVKKVNESLAKEAQLENQCVQQINQTVTQCLSCTNACGSQVSIPVQNFGVHSSSVGDSLKDILKEVALGSPDLALDLTNLALGGVEHLAHELGHGVDHLTHEIGHGVDHLTHELNHGIDHLAHELSHGAEHVAHEIGHGVEHVAHELSHLAHGAGSVIHDIGHGAEHVAHEVGKGVHHLGHELHHILGRRQKDCDLECPSCRKVRSNDTDAVKVSVCGSDYAKKVNELNALIPKFRQVAWEIKTRVIVQKVEYDPMSLDPSGGSVQFGTVYMTANVNGSPLRFKATAPYQMMHTEDSALKWAEQILNLFLV